MIQPLILLAVGYYEREERGVAYRTVCVRPTAEMVAGRRGGDAISEPTAKPTAPTDTW